MEITILAVVAAALIFGVAGYLARKVLGEKKIISAEARADMIIKDADGVAERKKKEALLEAKEETYQMRTEVEREAKEQKGELKQLETRLQEKEANLERRGESLGGREEDLSKREKSVGESEAELGEVLAREKDELEKIAGMSAEEAKNVLVSKVEEEAKRDAALLIRDIEAQAREDGEKRARSIVALAIQRCASDQVAETTVSVVQLPSDEMKGRIIGREGRNIRALETLTGINLIIDDTPEAVILSSFDPVRREIARLTLEKLIHDGRIHPARIEETFEKSKAEVEAEMRETGEAVSLDLDIHKLHPELIRVLGRLKFRTSYGQNVLNHSIEVAHLAAMMASELGVDVRTAKRAGLLHDLGKAIDSEVEGAHATIGADLAKRLKESPAVCHAISAHHAEVEPKTVEAVLVQSADAVSAARPGARRETLESYVKRLEQLEALAESHEGVEKSYAMQAGREIRVMVRPDGVDDEGTAGLARELAKQIEEELDYPGQIKVTVIRENRVVEYAK